MQVTFDERVVASGADEVSALLSSARTLSEQVIGDNHFGAIEGHAERGELTAVATMQAIQAIAFLLASIDTHVDEISDALISINRKLERFER